MGGDYFAASAEPRGVRDGPKTFFQKKFLTLTSEATTSPPPPTTGAKQWGPVLPVLVFEIVDLERETQAAVFLRWLMTTTIILKLRSFLKIPCHSFFGADEVVLVKNT
ncbi:hypothetical protein KOAAANKH_03766 [Brevundimonas sp. NIBR10]|nr:hypothetical protein KOAAANKH_03766 [Brevundimonas sp. NIBR10]